MTAQQIREQNEQLDLNQKKINQKRQALELWLGTITARSMDEYARLEANQMKAQTEAAHQKLFGEEMAVEGDTMGDTILGDSPRTVVHHSDFGKLAGMALLALGIGGPLAFLASKAMEPAPEQQEFVDTDTDTANSFRIYRP